MEAVPVEIEERTLIFKRGSFEGKIKLIDDKLESITIVAVARGRGQNKLNIVNSWGQNHALVDLLALVKQLMEYVD